VGFRAKSTKTRIETIQQALIDFPLINVLEQNPPKQGLKRDYINTILLLSMKF